MDKLLGTQSLPRLTHKDTENLNRLITHDKIELVIEKLPKNKSPGQDCFTGESHQVFKEELVPILLSYSKKFFFKNWKGRNAPKIFLQGQDYSHIKTRQRNHKKRKPQADILINLINPTCRNPQKNISKPNSRRH